MEATAKIILEPGTRIPTWIRRLDKKVEIQKMKQGPRLFRVIRIHGGDAHIDFDGSVSVRVPGSNTMHKAFSVQCVIGVRSAGQEKIVWSHRLCLSCMTLSCHGVDLHPGPGAFDVIVKYECETCKRSHTRAF
jgi:hypothetical protein